MTLTRKNDVNPFLDSTSLEFLINKNDASLFVVGSHTKKRPHTLTIGRTFDGHILDMLEVGISNYKAFSEFKSTGCGLGQKPMFVFAGDLFATSQTHQLVKNMLLDFYRGQVVDEIALTGLEYVIGVTAVENGVMFRIYNVQMKKSGTRVPRIELEEMGPRMDMKFGRIRYHDDDAWKQSLKTPKELRPKKVKNITSDPLGDKFGRVHVGRQDLGKLQTRKMKGLKRKPVSGDADTDGEPRKKTREQ